jgi:hypothetical protein
MRGFPAGGEYPKKIITSDHCGFAGVRTAGKKLNSGQRLLVGVEPSGTTINSVGAGTYKKAHLL